MVPPAVVSADSAFGQLVVEMKQTLWVPIWMIGLGAAHFFAPHWIFVSMSAVATVFLTSLLSGLDGPELHSETIAGFTVEELAADLWSEGGNRQLPLYLAGIGTGIVPATDWFTARVDGQTVLILEHIDITPTQESTRMSDISPRMEA